jgi:hypothetical protein
VAQVTIRRYFFKSFGLIALSLLLLYSGTAWAFLKCLDDRDSFLDEGYWEEPLSNPSDASDSIASGLHCCHADHQSEPMIETLSLPRLVKFADGVRSSKVFNASAIAHELEISRREAFLSGSPPILSSLSRHLVLSILRI